MACLFLICFCELDYTLSPDYTWIMSKTGGSSMKFNEKLLELRKRQGLSQEELGMDLQVSRQTVSKWEAGVFQS